jgi:Cu/Ag efflux pump CusA
LSCGIYATGCTKHSDNTEHPLALIFSIGILVDDAIVVVENIHRHFKIEGASNKNCSKGS